MTRIKAGFDPGQEVLNYSGVGESVFVFSSLRALRSSVLCEICLYRCYEKRYLSLLSPSSLLEKRI
jgi:hypothetical protein